VAVVATVILVLILRPWEFRIGSGLEVVAAENRVAIMFFENLTDRDDTDRWGHVVTNLLVADLSESHFIEVVSTQRIHDLLRLIGKGDNLLVDHETATRIARESHSQWMLMGSIMRDRDETAIVSQLVEVATGSVLASQKVSGSTDESIFSMVDELAVRIKQDLPLPAVARQELDRNVADVTTHSQEAYRHYVKGLDYKRKLYAEDAERMFEMAVSLDSTFAMAYYHWATVFRLVPDREKERELLSKALEHSANVGHKDRLYIQSWHARAYDNLTLSSAILQEIISQYSDEKLAYEELGTNYDLLGQRLRAIDYLNGALEIDPLNKNIYNQLAYLYDRLGEQEKSIQALNDYISLVPMEANPYDSKGELYAKWGKTDQAIESYEKAIEIKRDFYPSIEAVARLYVLKGQYARAEDHIKTLKTSGDMQYRRTGWLGSCAIRLHRGKFKEALRELDACIGSKDLDRTAPDDLSIVAYAHLLKALVYSRLLSHEAAVREYDTYVELCQTAYPDRRPKYWHLGTQILAESGDFNRAQKIADEGLDTLYLDPLRLQYYHYSLGAIAYSQGDIARARKHSEKADNLILTFHAPFMLGKVYLEAGMPGEAVEAFKKLSRFRRIWTTFSCVYSVEWHYYLGIAYELSGSNEEAIEQYETFLAQWKDADPDLVSVADAKERLAKLDTAP
jgi:tetratricopeptide (TPR) repeat protein